jgi:DNA polymerase-3 subunit epsilon
MEVTMKKSKNNMSIIGIIIGCLGILAGLTSFSNGALEALKTVFIGAIILIPSYLSYERNKTNTRHNTQGTHTHEQKNNAEKISAAPKLTYRKRRKLMDDYVVFDLETTGFQPTGSEILEIGAIKYKNNEEVDRFHTYVKPTRHISSRITKINGIDDEMVKDAPSVDEALPAFLDFAGKETLVAHNASFDMSFVLHYKGEEIPNYVSDTLSLSRKTFDHRHNKLTDWKDRLDLDHLGSHNSIDDCIVCHELYQHVKKNSDLK